MNKKIILLITLICLIGFISAIDFIPGMEKLSDGKYEISRDVSKGWNLLPCFLPSTTDRKEDISEEDILAGWLYMPIIKNYVQIHPENLIDDSIDVDLGIQIDENQILASSCWYYIEKSGKIKYTTHESYPTNRELSQGWNFIVLTPDMINKKIKDLGDCKIVDKIAIWENGLQEWELITPEISSSIGFDWEDFPVLAESWDAGNGALWHTPSACTLNLFSSPDSGMPPSIPSSNQSNLPINMGCLNAVSKILIQSGEYTYGDSSSKRLSLQIVRGATDVELSGIQVIIELSGNSYIETLRDNLPRMNEVKVYVLNDSQNNYGSATKISIAPIIKEDGVEKICDISSSKDL